MRTVNENKGKMKRVYAFEDTNFTYRGEESASGSSFYAFGMQEQVKFAGRSNAKGSLLVKELKKCYLD